MNKPQSNLIYIKGYGENFANLRKKEYNGIKDYTVRELAKNLSIAPSTISQIEKEKREPTVEQVNIYKEFFSVSLDYLIGESKVIKSSLKEICECTGLNEKSIENLSMNKDKYYGSMISSVIESDEFIKIIEQLSCAKANKDILEPSGELIKRYMAYKLGGNELPNEFSKAISLVGSLGLGSAYKQEIYGLLSDLFDKIIYED